MIEDARRLRAGTSLSCDVCVVGAGPAGVTAALELEHLGVSVILVEGGGTTGDTGEDTFTGTIDQTPHTKHPPLESLRQRRLGGTSNAWGGRCSPLEDVDFERAWPIGAGELRTAYLRAHEYLELGSFEYGTPALPGSEPLLRGGDQLRDDRILRYSRPTRFWHQYRRRLASSSKIRVLHHANCVGLDPAPDGDRIDRLVVAFAPNATFTIAPRAVVLAAGGLEVTRLLLAASEDGQGIGSGREHLGRYYMTHLDGVVGRLRFVGPPPRSAYSYGRTRDGVYARRIVTPTPTALRELGLPNFSVAPHMPDPADPAHGDSVLSAYALAKEVMRLRRIGFKSSREERRNAFDARTHLQNLARDPVALGRLAITWPRQRWLAERSLPSLLRRPRSNEFALLFSAEQSPNAESRVTLANQRDAYGVPRLHVRWRVRDEDVAAIATWLGLLSDSYRAGKTAVAEVPRNADELLDANRGFEAGTHAMGTTRMSVSPEHGVVDRDCRCHGIANLYIASGSVFPTGGYAAPTLTIVALAIRVAVSVERSLRPGAH